MAKKRTALLIGREIAIDVLNQWGLKATPIGYTHTMASALAYPKETYAKEAWNLHQEVVEKDKDSKPKLDKNGKPIKRLVPNGSLPSTLNNSEELKAAFREPKRGYRVHVTLMLRLESQDKGEQWVTLNRIAIEPDGFVLAVRDKLSDITSGSRGYHFDYDEFVSATGLAVDVFVWHNKKTKPTSKRKVKNPGSIKGMNP